jgi:hypothetical protein
LASLKQVARAYPADVDEQGRPIELQLTRAYPADVDEQGRPIELQLIMDNYATHKRVEVREWLAANPRINVHFTPTGGSWLNLVEVWFGIIDRQAIRRGVFGSVEDLNAKIRAFIDSWNDRCHPFVWPKTADEILSQRPTVTQPQKRRTRLDPHMGRDRARRPQGCAVSHRPACSSETSWSWGGVGWAPNKMTLSARIF